MTGLLDTYLGCKPGYLPRTYVLKNYAENAKWSWSWACIINTDPTKWCSPRVSFLPKPESSYTEPVSWLVVFIYSFQCISFQYVLVHPINWSESSESCPVVSDSCDPLDYASHGILQARVLEGLAVPFSRGFSQPRDWTKVSHIASRFFTSWATEETQEYLSR